MSETPPPGGPAPDHEPPAGPPAGDPGAPPGADDPTSPVVLDKPGALEAVRCVTAVVDVPGRPYAVSIETTFLKNDEDGATAIREISAALYETFDRLARSSDLGRVISER